METNKFLTILHENETLDEFALEELKGGANEKDGQTCKCKGKILGINICIGSGSNSSKPPTKPEEPTDTIKS